MKFMLMACLPLLVGCAIEQAHIQDQSFRDYLNFQDICQGERNKTHEYCAQLWKDYMDAKAKLPAKQEINKTFLMTINDSYVDPETAHLMEMQRQLDKFDDDYHKRNK